jgi:hypothetical protein
MSLQWSCCVCYEDSVASSSNLFRRSAIICVPDGCGNGKHLICKQCATKLKSKQCPVCREPFNDIVELGVVGSYRNSLDNLIDGLCDGRWESYYLMIRFGMILLLPAIYFCPNAVFWFILMPLFALSVYIVRALFGLVLSVLLANLVWHGLIPYTCWFFWGVFAHTIYGSESPLYWCEIERQKKHKQKIARDLQILMSGRATEVVLDGVTTVTILSE